MLYEILVVLMHMVSVIAMAAVLIFGFAFLIFLGDANARGKSLVSEGFDRLSLLVVYLSWFGPLWWFGFSKPLLMLACGATTVLCIIYAASFQAAASRRQEASLAP